MGLSTHSVIVNIYPVLSGRKCEKRRLADITSIYMSAITVESLGPVYFDWTGFTEPWSTGLSLKTNSWM